jgi:hypothetical protein
MTRQHQFRKLWRIVLIALPMAALAAPRTDASIDELKGRLSSAGVGDKPRICLEIAQKQLVETDKLYAADQVEKAQGPLTDVVSYSELARDYSIQSRKHQKQTEIAAREITRKLNDILHTLAHEEQTPIRNAINRMQRVRDDMLMSMFPKGIK